MRSIINEEMLKDLAKAGDGAYFNLASGSDQIVPALQERIDRMEKREFEQRTFSDYESYFQYFLGLALLLIVIEFLIPYRKSRFISGRDLFGSS